MQGQLLVLLRGFSPLVNWAGEGVTSIHNLCHQSEGRLLSHIEIRERYGAPCTFLEALALRIGIPVHWRAMITADFQGDSAPSLEITLPSGRSVPILKATAKKLDSGLILIGKPPQLKGNGTSQLTSKTLPSRHRSTLENHKRNENAITAIQNTSQGHHLQPLATPLET